MPSKILLIVTSIKKASLWGCFFNGGRKMLFSADTLVNLKTGGFQKSEITINQL